MNKHPDEPKLLQRVKASDREAFRMLFETYHPLLFRSLCYKTGDRALAKDLAQEAFLRVWIHRTRLKPGLNFYAYLEKMSRNLIIDHYKHESVKHKHRDHVQSLWRSPEDVPEKKLDRERLEAKIREVVNTKLAHKCRTVFILSRVEGLANQEIADFLGISKKTVENQLYHALKVLRKQCREFL